MTLTEYKNLEFPSIEKYLELIEELRKQTEEKIKGKGKKLEDT